MAAKPIKTLELHYTMIQFLIIYNICKYIYNQCLLCLIYCVKLSLIFPFFIDWLNVRYFFTSDCSFLGVLFLFY